MVNYYYHRSNTVIDKLIEAVTFSHKRALFMCVW